MESRDPSASKFFKPTTRKGPDTDTPNPGWPHCTPEQSAEIDLGHRKTAMQIVSGLHSNRRAALAIIDHARKLVEANWPEDPSDNGTSSSDRGFSSSLTELIVSGIIPVQYRSTAAPKEQS